MLNKVGTVCIFVADQDRAKDFYVNTLGLELRSDQPIYPGAPNRWLAVAPKGAETDIILYLPDQNWQHYTQVVGKSQAVTIDVTDMQAIYQNLKAKGVKFMGEPDVQPWGTNLFMYDSEGNMILLVELPKR